MFRYHQMHQTAFWGELTTFDPYRRLAASVSRSFAHRYSYLKSWLKWQIQLRKLLLAT